MGSHRAAFLLAYGRSLKLCAINADNPSCVRPDHLYAGDVSFMLDKTMRHVPKSLPLPPINELQPLSVDHNPVCHKMANLGSRAQERALLGQSQITQRA